jgi:hypothetical protein
MSLRFALLLLLSTLLAGCADATSPSPARPLWARSSGVPIEIDRVHGTVRVLAASPAARTSARFALMNGDAVSLTVGNLRSSALGEYSPGHVRVRFDIVVSHTLVGASLVTPTSPAPPANVTGLLLLPMQTLGYLTAGTATDGLQLAPDGSVVPSDDWNGNGTPGSGGPFNLFGSESCALMPQLCVRLLTLPSPMLAGQPSAPLTVGYDVEAGISTFRTWIVLAADVVDLPLP